MNPLFSECSPGFPCPFVNAGGQCSPILCGKLVRPNTSEPNLKTNFLRQRQALPLPLKIILSLRRIRQWYEAFDGDVYVAFSGGKDSTVLLDLVRSIYPQVPAVFCDTGLEYPEIRDFVKTVPGVVWLKPKMAFREVVTRYGFPLISKRVSQYVSEVYVRTGKNEATRTLRLTGINPRGLKTRYGMIPPRWQFLLNAPFKISDKCCDVMKKRPFAEYVKETGRVGIVGTLADEGKQRELTYIQTGCNSFDQKSPQSKPLSFWTEQDILQYIIDRDLPFASVYGNIRRQGKALTTTRLKRTGCMFCMFGIHMEKPKDGPNRFQRMQITHPKHWELCINTMNLREPLDFIGIPYEAEPLQMSLFEEE